MANKYVLTNPPVEAMQHDGSIARAYEILAWVYRHNGTGSLHADGELVVDPGATSVPGDSWVICDPTAGFSVMVHSDFTAKYRLQT